MRLAFWILIAGGWCFGQEFEVVSIKPNTGLFVDDPVTSDDQRLAYVIADDTGKTELHVLTVATNQEAVVDLAPVTHHPAALHLVGDRVFVVGIDDDKPHAALVELAAHGKSRPAGSSTSSDRRARSR